MCQQVGLCVIDQPAQHHAAGFEHDSEYVGSREQIVSFCVCCARKLVSASLSSLHSTMQSALSTWVTSSDKVVSRTHFLLLVMQRSACYAGSFLLFIIDKPGQYSSLSVCACVVSDMHAMKMMHAASL